MNARIVELTVQDLPEVVAFVCRQAGAQRHVRLDPAAAMPRYRWLLNENPRRRGDFIGWGLRDAAGALAGTNLCCWQHYERAGEIRIALHSGDYYVEENARGPMSLGLLLNMLRHPEADLSMCATANVNGAAVWEAIKGIPVEGSGHELLVPVNLTALAAGAFAGKLSEGPLRCVTAALGAWLPRIGPHYSCPPDWRIEEIMPADVSRILAPAATSLWEPRRDADWLSWRYAAGYSSKHCRLLRLSRSGGGGDVFAGTYIGSRGPGGRVRSLTVMDVWGAADTTNAPEALAALVFHFRKVIDVVSLRLLAAKLWGSQSQRRLRLRELTARTHWMISRKDQLDPADWSFSMGDGDGCA